jgi:tRNA (guanine-N7-)-methyltransferase
MTAAIPYLPLPRCEMTKIPFVFPAGFGVQNSSRTLVEIGPGRGDFLFHLAESNPDTTVAAIEIKRKRVDKLIKRVENRRLTNVAIIQDDARYALPRFFEENSVDAIYINFPDPWPKRRHEKNRVLSRNFLDECRNVLKFYGTLNITTDYQPYAEDVANCVSGIAQLETCYSEVLTHESPEAYPTLFAQKWTAMGRQIYYQKYQRII